MAKQKKSAQYTISEVETKPWFDIEQFMILSQNKRVDAASLATIEHYLPRFYQHLNARKIEMSSGGYVVVWLEKEVEDAVNQIWEESPSEAFTLNTLAQALLFSVIREVVPEVAAAGCAPVPHPNTLLKKALREVGVAWREEATLERQYAMLTSMPFTGGCPGCFLQESCPKAALERG